MKVGFIGAGKVGFTLGKYFCQHGVEVTGYYSRNIQSAQRAAAFTASDVYSERNDLIAESDVLFFTVPDGCIASAYEAVRNETIQGKIFCHCSGAMTADAAFPDIEQRGAFGFSVHPLVAVSDPYEAYHELADVFFTLEGSEKKHAFFQAWLEGLGLHVQTIDGHKKAAYHCAAAIASNLVVALFAESQSLLEECGFTPETARQALSPLFLGNARHVAQAGPVAALTGPVERGDADTLQKHMRILPFPDRESYVLLSQRLVALAEQKHPTRDYTAIKSYIQQETMRFPGKDDSYEKYGTNLCRNERTR